MGIVAVPPRLISYYASDPYTHTGKFEFQDPLDSNMHQHAWSQQLGCGFLKGGGYQAKSDQPGWFQACLAKNTNLSNLVYEAQMNITSGDCGGLIFEAVEGTPTRAYVFFVCQNGHFYFNRYDDGRNPGNWGPPNTRYSNGNELLNPLPNGFIPIAVVARPNQIVLYVNHNPVTTLTENMYQGGSIGVIAFDHTHTTTAVYKDVKVWKF